MVQPHNEAAAMVWGQTGAAYDLISFGLSDGIGHAVQALWPKPGEKVLDIGTGTGWAARLAAGMGAEVTAVDIADGMLDGARNLSAHLPIDFQVADAEALPFDDAGYDGVISTYGVMFAGDQAAAARELARVCKPGGRLVLTTWADAPDGYIARFFQLIGSYSDAPPPPASPMNWGDAAWIDATLGAAFDIHTQELTTTLFAPDAQTVWREYLKGFGPVQITAQSLPPDRQAAMRQDFVDMHELYKSGHGLRIARQAMLVTGIRR